MNNLNDFGHNDSLPTDQLLGAYDIVEAFTALRHELKLQVKTGRSLQEELIARLERLEQQQQQLQDRQQTAATNALDHSARPRDADRQLAESLAELDESLSRALLSLAQQECSTTTSPDDLLRQFDDTIKRAGTLKRWIAKTAFSAVRQILATASEQLVANAAIQKRTTHGLKLLHERLQRSMQRSELSRLETVGLPFDPERMRAIETVDNSNVPDGHVVDELRPGYRWGNNLLRCADVRIAKST